MSISALTSSTCASPESKALSRKAHYRSRTEHWPSVFPGTLAMISTASPHKVPVVEFYDPNIQPYGSFSNYFPSVIIVEGKSYPTVEHFYQCHKFTDNGYREIIRCASTPNKAKILARQQVAGSGYKWRTDMNDIIKLYLAKGVKLREDWEEVKESIMSQALTAKFDQHPRLAHLLISTGDSMIVENSPTDWYWGCGKEKKGNNRLGCLLMSIRSRWKRERTKSPLVSGTSGAGQPQPTQQQQQNYQSPKRRKITTVQEQSISSRLSEEANEAKYINPLNDRQSETQQTGTYHVDGPTATHIALSSSLDQLSYEEEQGIIAIEQEYYGRQIARAVSAAAVPHSFDRVARR